ncbi:VOC family protein [Cellulomonas sp. URHB0016]
MPDETASSRAGPADASGQPAQDDAAAAGSGRLHHLELWVADLPAVADAWAWLLGELGFRPRDRWADGLSWSGPGGVYVVVECGPDVLAGRLDRRRPGLNHLAFWAGSEADVDRLVAAGPEHGWTPLFADRYPFAGGPAHYAAYLENADGFEVELVARS